MLSIVWEVDYVWNKWMLEVIPRKSKWKKIIEKKKNVVKFQMETNSDFFFLNSYLGISQTVN